MQAAAMLRRRLNLTSEVTPPARLQERRVGVEAGPRHGGYAGTLAQARAQHPPWSRRVTHQASATFRHIFRFERRDGS